MQMDALREWERSSVYLRDNKKIIHGYLELGGLLTVAEVRFCEAAHEYFHRSFHE